MDPTEQTIRQLVSSIQGLQQSAQSVQDGLKAALSQAQTLLPKERRILPGQDLTDILNTTAPDVALLFAPGVYGRLILPPHTGPTARILRAQYPIPEGRLGGESLKGMPEFRSVSNEPALQCQGDRYSLLGLEVTSTNPAGDLVQIGFPTATTISQQPSEIVLDRMYIHGDPTRGQKRGIALHGRRVSLINSAITEIKRAGQDAQAIYGNNGPGEWVIHNNLLEATGENILFGGDRIAIPNLVPTGIQITSNTIRKPLQWMTQTWDHKNLLEIKVGRQIQVRGNIFDGCWPDNQTGYAILLTPMNQYGDNPWVEVSDVTVEYNRIQNVSSALNLSGYDSNGKVSLRSHGYTVRHNLALIDRVTLGGQGDFLLVQNGPEDLLCEHNTILSNGKRAIYTDGGKTYNTTRGVFQANLFQHNEYGMFGAVVGNAKATMATYYPGGTFLDNVVGGGPAKEYPAGNLFPTLAEFNAAFVDRAAGDYRLTPGAYPTIPLAGADLSQIPS